MRDKLAYVMVLDVEGTEYEAAFDAAGALTVTLSGEEVPVEGEALTGAVSQAQGFYDAYLKEVGEDE